MLKELYLLGKYVKLKYEKYNLDPIGQYIDTIDGEFFVIPLVFNGTDITFDEKNIKEGDQNDLMKIGFKSVRGQVKPIMPASYIEPKKIKTDKLSLSLLLREEPICNLAKEKIEKFDSSIIEQSLQNLLKKDTKYILTLAFSKDFVKNNNLTVSEEKKFYFPAEIKEFKEFFIKKSQGLNAKTKIGFCHICEENKRVIDFKQSENINFPYKFFTLDKKGFIYELNEKNSCKVFGVCQNCYDIINVGYNNIFSQKLYKNVLGEKAFVFPSIYFPNEEQIWEIYKIFEEEKQTIEIEKNIENKSNQQSDFFDQLFEDENKQKTIINNKFIKINLLFGRIDKANSDTLKIQFLLKDILPSKIYKYYKSIELNRDNLKLKYFSNNIPSNLGDLYLFPTYKKGSYKWNLRDFFYLKGSENYYTFLNKILHDEKINEDWIRRLIYEKLTTDFKENYVKNSKNNFMFKVWECILVIEYFKYNNHLNFNKNTMLNLEYLEENEKLKNLANWFKQNDTFTSYDEIYLALIGLYIKLLLNKQNEKLGSMPFVKEITFNELNYDKIEKLLFKARDKFNKYSENKFDYHPSLFKGILETSQKIEKKLQEPKISYYLSIGMEILPKIYFDKNEETEN